MNKEILRSIREKSNLTQKEVAEKLNIPRSTYNSYEQGIADPNVEKLIKLSQIFNVTIDKLVGNEISIDNETQKVIDTCKKLNHVEISKLIHYAEGMIMNRQYEQKQKIIKIIEEK